MNTITPVPANPPIACGQIYEPKRPDEDCRYYILTRQGTGYFLVNLMTGNLWDDPCPLSDCSDMLQAAFQRVTYPIQLTPQ